VRTYLAGPINGKTDAECNDWRARFKALPGEWADPMARDYRGKEDESVDEIVEGDKDDIDCCERVIVMAESPSWGTAMEVIYAYQQNQEVWAICPQERISPWLRYHSTRIFKSVDEAIAAL
jgi:hypothetical protein